MNNDATNADRYQSILDDLLSQSGGKESCVQQVLSEFHHKNFLDNYRKVHRVTIIDKIRTRFPDVSPDEPTDVEINSPIWNKHFMRIYFHINHRFFEYSVKTDNVEAISLFQDDGNKNYSKSFFSKIKGGSMLWDAYNEMINKSKNELEETKRAKAFSFFKEKGKQIKFIGTADFEELSSVKAPQQYNDGRLRYISGGHYYYYVSDLNGYLTFEEGEDLLWDSEFSKLFDEKIVNSVREK